MQKRMKMASKYDGKCLKKGKKLVYHDLKKGFPKANNHPWKYEASSDIACLLVHGFTGVPFELQPVGEELRDMGISHRAILLPGHGGKPEDLAVVHRNDWLRLVENTAREMRHRYTRLIIIGLSMGGTLALRAAAQGLCDAVCSLAAPVTVIDYRMFLARYAARLSTLRPRPRSPKQDYEYLTARDNLGYQQQAYAGIYQLYRLIRSTYKRLPRITQPVLAVHALHDMTVPYRNVEVIAERVSSSYVKLVSLPKSNHILPWDIDREDVFANLKLFINGLRHANQGIAGLS
jgi:carboxylesterase